MKLRKIGAIEFSFTWLFAIIIGAFILGGAIFAVSKLMSTSQAEENAKSGAQLEVLLNPLETSFESAKTTTLTTPADTRIYNICEKPGDEIYGRQEIKISQQSFNKWTDTGSNIELENKYIFSGEYSEGKNFYVFAEQFNFPYKVADLIYVTPSTEKYCFVGAPDEINQELGQLKQANLAYENCSTKKDFIKVCFDNTRNCNIEVDYLEKSVKKNNSVDYFETDALMYAAIFSDKEIYECQLSRLMSRANELAKIYIQKQNLISGQGCDSTISSDLAIFENSIENFKSSEYLNSVKIAADDVERQNYLGVCRLW